MHPKRFADIMEIALLKLNMKQLLIRNEDSSILILEFYRT